MSHTMPGSDLIGQHLLADLYGIAAERLTCEAELVALLRDSLRRAGFTMAGQLSHKFFADGAGVTAMALLTESHASLHTYPEYGYLALDVFSCGDADPADVLAEFVRRLSPTQVESTVAPRGRVPQAPTSGVSQR